MFVDMITTIVTASYSEGKRERRVGVYSTNRTINGGMTTVSSFPVVKRKEYKSLRVHWQTSGYR